MPFSHHSHSGQFCGHAKDTLAEVVAEATRRRMHTFCLTEHMPRYDEDELYPGEASEGITLAALTRIFGSYHSAARQLQAEISESASAPQILVGAEIEWIRPTYGQHVTNLLSTYPLDLFVGSVHHVHGVPIDYNVSSYQRALEIAGSEEALFGDYFDAQLEMLQALKPPVVGHLDLIRLLSNRKDGPLDWSEVVWGKIVRNLNFINEYGGLVEVNASGLRKGLLEPYPKREVIEKFHAIGGRFVLSDDSHGVEQVGTNYRKALQHLEDCGISKLSFLARTGATVDRRFPGIGVRDIEIASLWKHEFWNA